MKIADGPPDRACPIARVSHLVEPMQQVGNLRRQWLVQQISVHALQLASDTDANGARNALIRIIGLYGPLGRRISIAKLG